MSKEDSQVMVNLSEALREHTEIVKRASNQPLPPILFNAFCDECGKDTVHVSHIARVQTASTAGIFCIPAGSVRTSSVDYIDYSGYGLKSYKRPPELIKTCLSCGVDTYNGGVKVFHKHSTG